MNEYKSNYRLKQKRQQIDYHDQNYQYSIESALMEKEREEEYEFIRQEQISYINTMLFQYVDDNYDKKHQFVFKTYFLLKPKKLNYRTLAEATGYSVTSVSNIIKRMKQDIRLNLRDYIYGREIIRTS